VRFDRSLRRRGGLALIAVAVAGAGGAAAGTGSVVAGANGARTGRRTAVAARVLNVRDEGRLRFITSSGSELIDEGPGVGSFPGKVRVHFVYNGNPAVTARFTIFGRGGSISGRAKARLSNRGAFAITGGSGRYARIHGTGELFGVFTRRGYGLVVQTIGRLHY
jgi:hypothetical protein